jgi:hypothetical protein
MRHRSWITVVSAALALSLPSVALAETAVVSPFVGKAGVDSLQVLNITSLVASEVDFSMSFDHVQQLEAMPAGMNVSCLGSSSCLSGVAKSASVDVVIAGSVSKVGEEFEIFMVNYHKSRGIVRKKTWRISSDPTTMADKMSSLVTEILTGKSHEQAAKESDISGLSDLGSADMFEDEEEFSFDDSSLEVGRRVATPELSDYDLDDFELLDAESDGREAQLAEQRRAADAEAARKEEEARRQAEEEAERRAADEARRRAEEEARRRAEDERRRREEEEARRRADEERRREEAEAARRAEDQRRADDDRRRRADEERAAADAAEEEDDFELTFAPVSADDMGLDFAPAGGLITVEPAEDDYSDDSYVSDSYDDFDDFDDIDGSSVRRVEAEPSYDDFDDFDELDSLDDDGFDAARVREEERTRKQREREEAERRADAEARMRREDERRSGYGDDLDEDSGRSNYRGTAADNVIKSQYSERQRVAVTARVGTSGFQTLQFITYGGELAFGVGESARIHTGLEAFSVKREFDADQCEIDASVEGQVVGCTRWNTILPFHVGMRYQRSDVKVRPYFGGDVTLTPYTEDFQIAFGGRARAGVDFVPTEVFGININAGVGLLHGSEMQSVQKDMANTGLLWQISAGTVFML